MPFALRLTLGGAPNTPHTLIDPTPGSARKILEGIHPGDLLAIDQAGIPLEDARKLADDPGCPLELVQIDKDGKETKTKAGHDEKEKG